MKQLASERATEAGIAGPLLHTGCTHARSRTTLRKSTRSARYSMTFSPLHLPFQNRARAQYSLHA
eukprot:1198425-Pleurochrysis_carterae.AAC.1